MSMFKNVMVYLGLGPDEEYDDSYLYDDAPEHDAGPSAVGGAEPAAQYQPAQPAPVQQPSQSVGGATVGSVRPIRSAAMDDDAALNVRPIAVDHSDDSARRPTSVQLLKPRSLSPQSFGDAKILADEFKRSVPVVMNIQSVDRELARRLIDFSSGVCYSLGGTMEKLATDVFLVTPKGVEVSADDRRRIEERGFGR